jgi:urease alpha subunit
MVRHGRLGSVGVDPRNASVSFDGARLHFDPVDDVPLQRLYFL